MLVVPSAFPSAHGGLSAVERGRVPLFRHKVIEYDSRPRHSHGKAAGDKICAKNSGSRVETYGHLRPGARHMEPGMLPD